jgi:hypothetical protein
MTQKWNLQDIRPAQPKKRRPLPATDLRPSAPKEQAPAYDNREDVPNIVINDGKKTSKSRLIWSILIFVGVIGSALILSSVLGKSVVTAYPEHRQPNVSAEFTAYPDKRDVAPTFELMRLEKVGEAQVKASGQVPVKEQAVGVIEIVKTTPGAERLIKNTRFRTKDGLIFKIKESVVIPGSLTDSSGNSVPGTIRADVFSDGVGEKYNLPAGTQFDVPGFQEGGLTALYDAITARNPEAMTGGFDGPQFQIDANELGTARQALQVKLRDELLSLIETEKPAGTVLYKEAVAITYNQLPSVEYGQDLVTIRENAVLQVPVFNAVDFGSFLARETVPGYEGVPVIVSDPQALSFSYTSPTTSASVIANEPSLTFSLSGKPLLVWQFDHKKLADDLAGLPKTAINNAISAYPGLTGARVQITPFWKRTFPEDPSEIVIVEELKD